METLKLKILYCGLYYDYGNPNHDTSYEFRNIEAGFRNCSFLDVTVWNPDKPAFNIGKLKSIVDQFDAIFHVAFNESFDLPLEVSELALTNNIPVIQWDCDASWRFENWILPRKNRVSHFVTTHSSTINWYEKHGMNVIKSQWGCSPVYTQYDGRNKKYDVSFCGQKHGIRPQIISFLQKENINVELFGNYWEGWLNNNGHTPKLSQFLDVLHSSKINLNLSNPWHVNTLPQIKGRMFEIPITRNFQIATYADNIEEYFVLNKEIVVANSLEELKEKILYYLENDNERELIIDNAYHRCLRDHSWENRLKDIFGQIGLL